MKKESGHQGDFQETFVLHPQPLIISVSQINVTMTDLHGGHAGKVQMGGNP